MRPATLSSLNQHVLPDNSAPAGVRQSNSSTSTQLVPRGRALFWQGERQAHRIKIVDGVVRAVRLLESGNRQILSFYWPGDTILPTHSSCQHFTAEAVTNCRVTFSASSPVFQVDEPCGSDQVLSSMMALVLTMGQKNSIERIAWLLLRIRRHLPDDSSRPSTQRLMLPRADIADHVGTSLETVCRALADFRSRGFIDLPNRKTIRFLNLHGLAEIAGD